VSLRSFIELSRAEQPSKVTEEAMPESIYNVIELIGTSENSWEDAAKNAVETACKSIRNLRIAEVDKLDLKVENSKVIAFRVRIKLSFKYDATVQKNWSDF
jgi:dodecin